MPNTDSPSPPTVIRSSPPEGRIFPAIRLGGIGKYPERIWRWFLPLFIRQSGPAIGLAAWCILLILGGALGFAILRNSLHAFIVQWGPVRHPARQPIFLIKKDQATADFLFGEPGRKHFASVLRFLGKPHSFLRPASEEKVRRLDIVGLSIGRFETQNKSNFESSLAWIKRSARASAGSLLTFREQVFRLPGFLALPSFQEVSRTSGPHPAPALLPPHGIPPFLENFLNLRPGFEIDCLSGNGSLISVTLFFDIDSPPPSVTDAAAAIAVDVVFRGKRSPSEDFQLERAIAESEAPIGLAALSQRQREESKLGGMALRPSIASDAAEPSVVSGSETGALRETTLVLPENRFLKGKAQVGFIDTSYVKGSFIHAFPLFQIGNEGLGPSLCLLSAVLYLDRASGTGNAYLKAMRTELERIRVLIEKKEYSGGVQLLDRFIPTFPDGTMEVYFFGDTMVSEDRPPVFPSLNMHQCLDEEMLRKLAEEFPESGDRYHPTEIGLRTDLSKAYSTGGKLCFIGSFHRNESDFFETPFTFPIPFSNRERQMTGSEINANAILTILEGRFIRPGRWGEAWGLAFILALITGKVMDRFRVFRGGAIILVSLSLVLTGATFLYHTSGFMIDLAPSSACLFLTWLGCTLSHYLSERQKARSTQEMFQRFVAADVVDYMVEHPELVRPGGQKTELTILFSDLAGFSTISEMLTVEQLVELLNEYLGAMTDVLFEFQGTLDKFIGDAVMAFWNHPRVQSDHALRACLCALAMQDRIRELRKGWDERGFPRVSARIGLNTAVSIVGYMGSANAQMNFTCMGDGVNLASRLEGANKQYGTLIMIGETTFRQAQDGITARFLDLLTVKGKSEPVKVYELLSQRGREPTDWAEHVDLYDRGMREYEARRWAEAADLFGRVIARWPEDGAAKTYLDRCHEFQAHPPPDDWDGVYRLTHK